MQPEMLLSNNERNSQPLKQLIFAFVSAKLQSTLYETAVQASLFNACHCPTA